MADPTVDDAVQQWNANNIRELFAAAAAEGLIPPSGGSALNVMLVPWTGITLDTGGRYTVELGAPSALFGEAGFESDWIINPGTPGTDSAQLTSASRTAMAWLCIGDFQSGPEGSVRRVFMSAFEDVGGPIVGVEGAAHGFQNNNDRGQVVLSHGGLAPGDGLFFECNWNGVAPLTLNGGRIIVLST